MTNAFRISRVWRVGIVSAAALSVTSVRAQLSEQQMRDLETQLPPPATKPIDFDRDIRPILDNTCVRCHGPERPKSHFRIDSREAALKGGENGIDILEGNSARSPLAYYIAGLVKDMEMPPPGKGHPLDAEQVGLIRAWIDQGVKWGAATNEVAKLEFSITPELRWFSVKGNERMFREHTGIKEGFSGGAQSVYFREQTSDDRSLTLQARAFANPEEYDFKLNIDQRNFGFVHAGASNYREYYNDVGGYFPAFNPPAYALGRDLHLDVGKIWIDLGLTLPDWPTMVFGYEYQSRDGSKSLPQWGDGGTVDSNGVLGPNTKKIYPASKNINEDVHIIKFDLTHDINGYGIENRFRTEFYDNRNSRDAADFYNVDTQNLDKFVRTQQSENHFQASDSIRLDKQVRDWLYLSGGYRYSRLEGNFSFNNTTLSPSGAFGPTDNFWFADSIVLDQDSHVANANAQLGPWDGFSIYGGAQAEWMSQRGFGNVRLDEGAPGTIIAEPASLDANLSRAAVEETVGAKFTGLPFTVLFVEGRFGQESISQFEQEIGGDHEFLRDTDASSDLKDGRVGVTISPDPRFSFTTQYKHRNKKSSYNHLRDEAMGVKNEGYSAFIKGRETDTDDLSVKVAYRPASWIQTSLNFQHITTKYKTETDALIFPALIFPDFPEFNTPEQVITPGGVIFSGDYRADVFGGSISLTPWHRLTLSGSLTYTKSRTSTAQNVTPAVVNYTGDTYTGISSAAFNVNAKTDLTASYTYSTADYGQDNYVSGLPVGLVYSWHIVSAGVVRKINDNITATLQYRFYGYDEPNTGGANNYTAHGVIGAVTIALK